jgi:hypothetical protein
MSFLEHGCGNVMDLFHAFHVVSNRAARSGRGAV